MNVTWTGLLPEWSRKQINRAISEMELEGLFINGEHYLRVGRKILLPTDCVDEVISWISKKPGRSIPDPSSMLEFVFEVDPPLSQYGSITDYAKHVGVSRWTVHTWINQGRLTPIVTLPSVRGEKSQLTLIRLSDRPSS